MNWPGPCTLGSLDLSAGFRAPGKGHTQLTQTQQTHQRVIRANKEAVLCARLSLSTLELRGTLGGFVLTLLWRSSKE